MLNPLYKLDDPRHNPQSLFINEKAYRNSPYLTITGEDIRDMPEKALENISSSQPNHHYSPLTFNWENEELKPLFPILENPPTVSTIFHQVTQKNSSPVADESSKKRKREISSLETPMDQKLPHKKSSKNKTYFSWNNSIVEKIKELWNLLYIHEKTPNMTIIDYARLTHVEFQKSCNAHHVSLEKYQWTLYNKRDLYEWIKKKIKNLK